MKTNTFYTKNLSPYLLIGLISILITSCGSYQNSSYYDSDGIYGNSGKAVTNNSSNHYKEYFNSLQTERVNDTIQSGNQDYPDWGSSSNNSTIVVYTNPWSMNFGFDYGFGYPNYGWGGNNWGWGYNNWSWGYNNWGWGGNNWGYPYYGYGNSGYYNNNNYSYNSSRRGSSYRNDVNGNRYSQNPVPPAIV